MTLRSKFVVQLCPDLLTLSCYRSRPMTATNRHPGTLPPNSFGYILLPASITRVARIPYLSRAKFALVCRPASAATSSSQGGGTDRSDGCFLTELRDASASEIADNARPGPSAVAFQKSEHLPFSATVSRSYLRAYRFGSGVWTLMARIKAFGVGSS